MRSSRAPLISEEIALQEPPELLMPCGVVPQVGNEVVEFLREDQDLWKDPSVEDLIHLFLLVKWSVAETYYNVTPSSV